MSFENNEVNRYGCYRFGSVCPELPIENKKIRVYTKPFYKRCFDDYTLIGVDKESVCLADRICSKFQFVSEIRDPDCPHVSADVVQPPVTSSNFSVSTASAASTATSSAPTTSASITSISTATSETSTSDNLTDPTTSTVTSSVNAAITGTTIVSSSSHSRFSSSFSGASKKSEEVSFLVLTTREKTEIMSFCFLSPVKITVLEEEFPFLSGIRYVDDSKINYENLCRYIKKIRNMKLEIDCFQSIYTSLHKKISRKLPFKSSYDNAFFYHPVFSYQEVFKFRETRKDRIIVALDFNSMYASVMDGLFPHPKYLEKTEVNSFFSSEVKLQKGLYLVSLSQPDSFISRYHAVRYVKLLKNYPFVMKPDDTVDTILSDEEIAFYSKHFGKIYIHSGYSSKITVKHPLLQNRNSLYSSRLHYKKTGNQELASFQKMILTLLHSVPNKRKSAVNVFSSFEQMTENLSDIYGVNKPKGMSDEEFLLQINRGKFGIRVNNDVVSLVTPDIDNACNIYSLYSLVIARARIKMMETIRLFSGFEDLEVCYANVDSLHVSVPRESYRKFEQFLFENNLLGEKLGQLKIENTASHGIWFFPGRYWLYDDERVVQFKNINLNSKYGKDSDFNLSREISIPDLSDNSMYSRKLRFTFGSTLYIRKVLVNDDFRRLSVAEIKNDLCRDEIDSLRKRFIGEISALKKKFE